MVAEAIELEGDATNRSLLRATIVDGPPTDDLALTQHHATWLM
jgi:hypothetical protein